jgi:hypothetical protein
MILLPQHPKCWDYKYEPSHLVISTNVFCCQINWNKQISVTNSSLPTYYFTWVILVRGELEFKSSKTHCLGGYTSKLLWSPGYPGSWSHKDLSFVQTSAMWLILTTNPNDQHPLPFPNWESPNTTDNRSQHNPESFEVACKPSDSRLKR